jgi:uncharacterized protein (DUF2249 family)
MTSSVMLSLLLLGGCSVEGAPMSEVGNTADHRVDDGGLFAPGPDASLAEKLGLYGQFVGDWDVVATSYKEGGVATTRRGEWNFRWALEGRAVQDVFIVPARGARARDQKQSYGTTVRFYDPQRDVWEITYVDPVYALVFRMTARMENGEIVQTGVDHEGRTYRWVFFDIRPDSFRWRSELWQNDAKVWRKEQDFVATRKAATPSTRR